VDLADFLAQVADDFGGVVEPGVHRGSGGLEIVGDGLAKRVEPLLHRVELLLEHRQRLVGLGSAAGDQHDDRDQREYTEDDRHGFHDAEANTAPHARQFLTLPGIGWGHAR